MRPDMFACTGCTPEGCACDSSRRSGSRARSCSSSPSGSTREAGSWRLYGYRRDTDTADGASADLRRERLPRAALLKAVGWALDRGCDTVLLERGSDSERPFPAGVVHHVCADSGCPGGC